MEKLMEKMAREIITLCAEKYGFSVEEALNSLELVKPKGKSGKGKSGKGKSQSQSSNKVRAVKHKFPLPYNGEPDTGKCSALRQNCGLYTQCHLEKTVDSDYCKHCLVLSNKSSNGVPEYGTIEMRLSCGIQEYVDPKGRKPTAYAKIMKKYNVSREEVEEEASIHGITVSELHFVVAEDSKRGRPATKPKVAKEAKGVKGRPKKAEKAIRLNDEPEDLFASLLAEAEKPNAEEERSVAEEDPSVAEEDNSVAEEENSVVEEDNSVAEEENSVAEEDNSVAEEDNSVAEEDSSVAEEDSSVAEEENSVAEEENSVVEQNSNARERAYTSPSLETLERERSGMTTEDKNINPLSDDNSSVTSKDSKSTREKDVAMFQKLKKEEKENAKKQAKAEKAKAKEEKAKAKEVKEQAKAVEPIRETIEKALTETATIDKTKVQKKMKEHVQKIIQEAKEEKAKEENAKEENAKEENAKEEAKTEEPPKETYKKFTGPDGKKYLRSTVTNIVFDFEVYSSQHVLETVGKWNPDTKSMVFNVDDSESELSDEEFEEDD